MNKIRTLLAASLAVAALGHSATAQVSADSTPQQTSDFRLFEPTGADWERFRSTAKITHQGGEAVYLSLCAGCHMPRGQGAIGAGKYPKLANNELLAGAAYPIHLVVNGQHAMPPLGGFLDDQQIADVVNYIRSNFGNDFIAEYGKATPEEVAGARP